LVEYTLKGLDVERQRSVLLLKPFFITEIEAIREFERVSERKATYYRFAKDREEFAAFYGDFSVEDVIERRTSGGKMVVVMNFGSDYTYFVKTLRVRGLEVEDLFDGIVVLEVNMKERDIRKAFKLVELEKNYNRLSGDERKFLKDIKLMMDWGVHMKDFYIPRGWLKEVYEIKGLVEMEGEYVKVYPHKLEYLVRTEKNLNELRRVYELINHLFEPLYTLAHNLYIMLKGFEIRGVEDFLHEILSRLLEVAEGETQYVKALTLRSFVLSEIERDYINALDSMSEALELARKRRDKVLLGRVLFDLGRIYASLSYFYGTDEDMDRAYEKFWEGYLLLGDSTNLEFYNFMVNYFAKKRDLIRFLKWVDLAANRLGNLTKLRGILTNTIILGLYEFHRQMGEGDRHRLENFVFRTISDSLDKLDKRLKIQILVNFAFYLGGHVGRYEEALKLLDTALSIAESEGSRAFVLIDRGYIHMLMGKYELAYEDLKFSYEYCVENFDIVPKNEFKFLVDKYMHVLSVLGKEQEIKRVKEKLKKMRLSM